MQSGLTLFAFDCSGSVDTDSLYFTTLQSIVDKYYVKDRGDIFVKWDNIFRYETYEELQTWIKSQKGYGGTSAELIAQVLKEQGPKIKHLIMDYANKAAFILFIISAASKAIDMMTLSIIIMLVVQIITIMFIHFLARIMMII